MVNTESDSLIRKLAQEAPDISQVEDDLDFNDVYVFISLDLTNSTKFKSEQPHLWKFVISAFYDVVFNAYGIGQYQSVLKNLPDEINVEFWKFVGDEVLLYVAVYDCSEIYKIVKSTDEAVKKIIGWIFEKVTEPYACQKKCSEKSSESFCSFYEANYSSCKIDDILQNSLGVKATVWLALCGKSIQARNIIYKKTSATGDDWFRSYNFDFLGPEIDEGFRIAKYAVKNRVVVSPFLANTLYTSADESNDLKTIVENHFAIVSYQRLKGIWSDRLFPIVMYSSSLEEFNTKWDYDEIELPTYSEIRISGIANRRCKASYLTKILKDVHLSKEVDSIVELLGNTHHTRVDKKQPSPPMEIHVACATFDEQGMLMVKNHEVRGWEFGCVHISPSTVNWKNAIIEGYKTKYDLDILVEEDPVPIATYVYQKSQKKKALGLIVVGKLCSFGKSTQFVPMNLQQINEIKDKTVPNFKENSQKAFATHYNLVKE